MGVAVDIRPTHNQMGDDQTTDAPIVSKAVNWLNRAVSTVLDVVLFVVLLPINVVLYTATRLHQRWTGTVELNIEQSAARQIKTLPECEIRIIDDQNVNLDYFTEVELEDNVQFVAPKSAIHAFGLKEIGEFKIIDEARMLQYVKDENNDRCHVLLSNIQSKEDCKKNLFLPTIDEMDTEGLDEIAQGRLAKVYSDDGQKVKKLINADSTRVRLSSEELIKEKVSSRLQLMANCEAYVSSNKMALVGNEQIMVQQEKLNKIDVLNEQPPSHLQCEELLRAVETMKDKAIHGNINPDAMMKREDGKLMLISASEFEKAKDGYQFEPMNYRDIKGTAKTLVYLINVKQCVEDAKVAFNNFIDFILGQDFSNEYKEHDVDFISMRVVDDFIAQGFSIFHKREERQHDDSIIFKNALLKQGGDDPFVNLKSNGLCNLRQIKAYTSFFHDVMEKMDQFKSYDTETFLSQFKKWIDYPDLSVFRNNLNKQLQSNKDNRKALFCLKLDTAFTVCMLEKTAGQRIEEVTFSDELSKKLSSVYEKDDDCDAELNALFQYLESTKSTNINE